MSERNNNKHVRYSNKTNNTSNQKKVKSSFLGNSLLLKQTLIAAWKSKLQLVILLLLTTFATSLITGAWISYQRVVEGEKYLALNAANFDAVLPYEEAKGGVHQIANQMFSLKLGRLFYQGKNGEPSVALYYDNTVIGQEIKKMDGNELQVTYQRDDENKIINVESFQWTNPSQPLIFDATNERVRASVYGQLLEKANNPNNSEILRAKYLNAANDLYNNLFVNFSANQILNSLKTYFIDWIKVNQDDVHLKDIDKKFTEFLIKEKINYQGNSEATIPDEANVEDFKDSNSRLSKTLVKYDDENPSENPRLKANYGMNGQWMTIYRKFDLKDSTDDIIKDFSNKYSSPSNYNVVADGSEPNIYSYNIANAAAALQNRSITVVNQFVGTAGIDPETGKSVSVKVVDIGLESLKNNVNLKIFEGIYPSSKNEIAISPQYARKNKVKPGSTITINNRQFIVSGIGGDAYNIYPTINALDPVPNTRTEFIAYAFPDIFNDSSWFGPNDKTDVSIMYFNPWKDVTVPDFDISYFNDFFQKTIFNDNKVNDRNQFDYNNYLIEKYGGKSTNLEPLDELPDDKDNKYHLEQNFVITKDNAQFAAFIKGRNLLNSTLTGFKYASIVFVIFLVSIVTFITYLIVKKAIQKGQVSMGILKSSGYTTNKILISYLAYPLLVLLISVPLGWFIGLAVQVYFTELFNSLFILPYNVLDFNFIPLLISILSIVGFVLVTTLITSYKMLQKKPLMLIKKDSDIISVGKTNKVGWLHTKVKNNFKSRFLLSLSRTNWKKIVVTSLVIAVASLAITATVSVPATINSMKYNYFKTQKYKNYYQYQTPLPNMPLSKYGLYAWDDLNNSKNEPFYPVSAIMPWPENIIINDKNNGAKLAWYDPLDYQKQNNTNNFKDIIKFSDGISQEVKDKIIKQIGDNLLNLGNGPLDMSLLTWSYSWLGGKGFSNTLLKDLADRDKSENQIFSSSLINFASTLLPGILQVPTPPGIQPGRDAITEILKQTLPGYIRQILDNKGINAYDYFSIGHNTVAYNPNYNQDIGGSQEELVTQLQLGSSDNKLINKGFLDIEGINPDTKMLIMNSDLVEGLKYKELDDVVPMVINQSFAAKYKLSVGQTFNAAPNVRTLYYLAKDGIYKPLPKVNWYYGKNPLNQTSEGKKSVWSNSANKWNYRGKQTVSGTDFTDSYGYKYDGVYDKDGRRVLSDSPAEWTDVNDIWLQLPDDINTAAKSGTLRTSDTYNNLPFNIKNIAIDGNSNWIKPFSYNVTDKYSKEKIDPTTLLTTKIPEWYGGMLDKQILLVDNTLHADNLKDNIENDFPAWWTAVVSSGSPITKYHIIGVQNSYDTPRAYIDQKWANLIAGYSYFDERKDEKDPTYSSGIYQWFSGKLSASDDIYDMIARMSFKRFGDDYTMYAMNSLNGNNQEPLIANSDLLSRKKEMLDKMSDIAFAASLLFIITTIVCSILIVIMITDSFTEQFRRFMSHMKAEGYTNNEINSFTLGIFTPWALLGYVLGFGLGYLVVFGFIKLVTVITGLALPFSFIWWVIPFSFIIIAGIYISTFVINIIQLNKMNLIAVLKTDE